MTNESLISELKVLLTEDQTSLSIDVLDRLIETLQDEIGRKAVVMGKIRKINDDFVSKFKKQK